MANCARKWRYMATLPSTSKTMNANRCITNAKLQKVFEPVMNRLNQLSSTLSTELVPSIKVTISRNGHFYDRISDRAFSPTITAKNFEYLIGRMLTNHLCELLFLKIVYPNQQFACYKQVPGGNIAIGFTMSSGSDLVINVRTYIRDHRLNTTGAILLEIK